VTLSALPPAKPTVSKKISPMQKPNTIKARKNSLPYTAISSKMNAR
jgi:hypothetical protein